METIVYAVDFGGAQPGSAWGFKGIVMIEAAHSLGVLYAGQGRLKEALGELPKTSEPSSKNQRSRFIRPKPIAIYVFAVMVPVMYLTFSSNPGNGNI